MGPEESARDSARTRLAYDEELSRTFVEFLDRESGAVVAKFPPEEIVRFARQVLAELPDSGNSPGRLVDHRV